jgi:hypothetical protein
MHIHLLTIDISTAGNAGAVGLYWCVAQQTSLRDLRFTVGGAFSAIDMCVSEFAAHAGGGGNGGGGTVEDVATPAAKWGSARTRRSGRFAGCALRASGAPAFTCRT